MGMKRSILVVTAMFALAPVPAWAENTVSQQRARLAAEWAKARAAKAQVAVPAPASTPAPTSTPAPASGS